MKLTSKSKKTMSKSQIKEFIMFYERITKTYDEKLFENIRFNYFFRQKS